MIPATILGQHLMRVGNVLVGCDNRSLALKERRSEKNER
jgi:hypothetical protein